MKLSHLLHVPDRQKAWLGIMAIVTTTTMLAIPFTAFQYLDMQYRAQHTNELQYITNQWTVPEDQSVVTNYGYRATPWTSAMNMFTLLYVIVPALMTICVSAAYLIFSRGSLRSRFSRATLLAAAIIPTWFLCELPWGAIYWDGYEWPLAAVISIISGSLVVLIATLVNSIMCLMQKNTQPT